MVLAWDRCRHDEHISMCQKAGGLCKVRVQKPGRSRAKGPGWGGVDMIDCDRDSDLPALSVWQLYLVKDFSLL